MQLCLVAELEAQNLNFHKIKLKDMNSNEPQKPQLNIGAVMCSYLILDKSNKVVAEKATLEQAEFYVKARPYLRYEKFEQSTESVACDLDGIL